MRVAHSFGLFIGLTIFLGLGCQPKPAESTRNGGSDGRSIVPVTNRDGQGQFMPMTPSGTFSLLSPANGAWAVSKPAIDATDNSASTTYGFETGLSPLVNTASAWVPTSSKARSGTFSAVTPSGSLSQNQWVEMALSVTGPGTVSFYYQVASGYYGTSYLRFYVDGVQVNAWSGNILTWTYYSRSLSAGNHTLKWLYIPTGNYCTPTDLNFHYCGAAWVDTVTVPGSNVSLSSTTPTYFDWGPSAGATYYQLWIDGLLFKDNIATSAYSLLPGEALTNNWHTWAVKACDAVAPCLDSNETFSVRIDGTGPSAFNLADPVDELITKGIGATTTYGFETSISPFVNTGNAWARTSSKRQSGTYSAYTPQGSLSKDQAVEMTHTVVGPGIVSFYYQVKSGYYGTSYLRFFVDGVEINKWPGDILTWSYFSTSLSAGSHTLKWQYTPTGNYCTPTDLNFHYCGAAWFDTVTVSGATLPLSWAPSSDSLSGLSSYKLYIDGSTLTHGFGAGISPFVSTGQGWVPTSAKAQSGTFSAVTPSGSLSQNQAVEMTHTVVGPGIVSFYYQVKSGYYGTSYLRFFVDGVEINKWPGDILTWSYFSTSLSAGSHTLKWQYTPTGNYCTPTDLNFHYCGAAWIDTVTVPGAFVSLSSTTAAYDLSIQELPDGKHTWQVEAIDNTGNVTSSGTRNFYLDRAGPINHSILTPVNSWTTNTTPNFSWSPATDPVSPPVYGQIAGYEIYINGAYYASTSTATSYAVPATAPLADGTRTWYVRAFDGLANYRDSASRSFSIDTRAPNVTNLSSPAADGFVVIPTPTFTWGGYSDPSPSSGFSKFQLWIDGALNRDNLSGTSAGPALMLAEGPHDWKVRAIDAVGNYSDSATRRVYVDTSVPAAFSLIYPDNVSAVSRNPEFRWQFADDSGNPIQRYEIWVDNVLAYTYAGPFTAPQIAEYSSYLPSTLTYGTHSWFVKAFDVPGNTVSSTQIYTFSVTPSAPIASSLTLSPALAYNSDALTAGYVYFDADGDVEIGTQIRWYRNGIVQTAYNNTSLISPAASARGEAWYFTVNPCDASGCGSVYSSPSVTIQNTPPTASALSLSPASPNTASNLTVSYSYNDLDGDADSGTQFRWYRNTVLQAWLNELSSVPATATTRGEQWYATVIPSDGITPGTLQTSPTVTIQNALPVATSLSLTPAAPYTGDNLTVAYTYSDIDGDSNTGTLIRWYRNSALQPAYNNLPSVPASATSKGQSWYFTVQPGDGTGLGNLVTSGSVTILNTIPSITSAAVTPVAPNTSDVLTCTPSGWSDADGDAPQYTYQWIRNAGTVAGQNAATFPAAQTARGDVIGCAATPYDDSQSGSLVSSPTVTILNSEPGVSSLAISPSSAMTNDPLTLSYIYSDPDSDTESGTQLRWYRNNVLQTWLNDLSLVPATATTRGEQWYATVRPSDATEYGGVVSSSTITINNAAPVASSLVLSPSLPTTIDPLTAAYAFADFDGDGDSGTQIRWSRNGVAEAAWNDSLTVPASATTKGDIWSFTIKPRDGISYGATVTSSVVTIQNTAPSITGVDLAPSAAYTNDTLTCMPTGWVDVDNDIADYQFVWFKNAVTMPGQTAGTLSGATQFNRGDLISCKATPNDGFASGTPLDSLTVTIQNTAPVATSLAMNPAAPRTADNLLSTYLYGDADGDGESGTLIRWYKDGVLQLAFDNLLTVPASATAKGEAWSFTVQPGDGSASGTAVYSSAVTVQNTSPVAFNLTLTPAIPDTSAILTSGYSYSDADADPDSGSVIRWYQNGFLVAVLTGSPTVSASYTTKGDQWYLTITPKDGVEFGEPATSASVTVSNSAPSLMSAVVSPATVYTNDTVTCNPAGWSDADGDAAGYLYAWYRNGVPLTTATSATLNGTTSFSKGDQVACRVTPYDGQSYGAVVSSPAVTVANTAPQFVSVMPLTAREGSTYAYTVTISDADNDAIAYSIVEGPAGLSIDGSGNVSWTPIFAQVGSQALHLRATDISGAAVDQSGTISVAFKDDDGDGMHDTWELAHGLNPSNPTDASGDLDGDGITNLEEWLNGLDPQISNAPSAASLNAPAMGSRYTAPGLVLLSVNNATDPDGDPIFYEFEIFTDAGMTQLFERGYAAEGSNSTGYAITTSTAENAFYYWRARAQDSLTAGPWMTAAWFQLNRNNEAPIATPTVSLPPVASEVTVLRPTLEAGEITDSDSDILSYVFTLCADATCIMPLYSQTVTSEGDGTTAWQVPVDLNDNTTYYWSVGAIDPGGLTSPVRGPVSFFVNTANDAPLLPAIVGLGSEVTSTSLTMNFLGSDPDQDPLQFYAYADTSPAFNSPGLISATSGSSPLLLSGLADNTFYYLRLRSSDSAASSPYTTATVFVNLANDPPGVPTLNNPSNGGNVALLQPLFSLYPATDADGDRLTYDFEVFTDTALTTRIAFATSVTETTLLVEWTPADNLPDNATLWWRARASDEHGLAGAWSAPNRFGLNVGNDLPSAPKPTSPAPDSEHEIGAMIELVADNATDADGDILVYRFELYNDTALASLVEKSSDLQAGAATTTYKLTRPLAAEQSYFWRVAAFDGKAQGAWSATARFQTPKAEPKPEDIIVEETAKKKRKTEGGGCSSYTGADSGGGGMGSILLALGFVAWVFVRRGSVGVAKHP